MLEVLLYPLVFSLGGVLWHDTMVMVLPPHFETWVEYAPTPRRAGIVFYIYLGDVREYDPETGEVGAEIRSALVGFEHEHRDYMLIHNDPMLTSLLRHNPYVFLAYTDESKPHRLYVYNRTDKYVWMDFTIWVAEFPTREVEVDGERVSVEEALRTYLRGIFYHFYRLGKYAERRVTP